MGGAVSYIGPKVETNGIFPVLNSVTAAYDLQRDTLELQHQVGNFVGAGANAIPIAGSAISFLLIFLTSMDFNGVTDALQKAYIDETLLANEINSYNGKITTIHNSFERLQRPDLTTHEQQPELVYAIRRSEYLFALFQQPEHLFHRYPLVSIPYLIKIMNILWTAIKLANELDPTMKSKNDRTLEQMRNLKKDYEDRFFETRLKDIDYKSCGWTIFDPQPTIYDRPWKNDWKDGIQLRFGGGPHPIKSHYKDMWKYEDVDDYKHQLKRYYEEYFAKSFPV